MFVTTTTSNSGDAPALTEVPQSLKTLVPLVASYQILISFKINLSAKMYPHSCHSPLPLILGQFALKFKDIIKEKGMWNT